MDVLPYMLVMWKGVDLRMMWGIVIPKDHPICCIHEVIPILFSHDTGACPRFGSTPEFEEDKSRSVNSNKFSLYVSCIGTELYFMQGMYNDDIVGAQSGFNTGCVFFKHVGAPHRSGVRQGYFGSFANPSWPPRARTM